MPPLPRLTAVLLAAAAALLLGACAPLSVTFTLGARDGRLKESTVIEDSAAWRPDKVALIDVHGVLIETPPGRALGLIGGGPSPVDEFVARLKLAEDDPRVRAVVLRINSPGGSVTASDTMYRELRRFRETTGKPVVASLGEVAASGAYYLALGADEIVAQPTSITASIGVIVPTINVSEGLGRIGVVARSVKSGANKDLANPLEPMRDSHYAVLQSMVDEFYARFRALVVERRTDGAATPLDPSRLDELTDGRVVTGAAAVRAGLADREGGLRDAFARAKALAGITDANLIMYHDRLDMPPRTPYAVPAAHAAAADPAPPNVSLISIDLGAIGTKLSPGNAYYLWLANPD